jgi:hypothetical protein
MPPMSPLSSRARRILAVVALAAACALALAAASPELGRWWTLGDAVAIGPRGTAICVGGDCRQAGLGWLGGDELWRRAAVGVTAASLITTVALAALAGALLAGRRATLAAGASLTALGTAAVAGVVFVATFPGAAAFDATVSLGRGVLFHAAGLVAGAGAALTVLARRRRG